VLHSAPRGLCNTSQLALVRQDSTYYSGPGYERVQDVKLFTLSMLPSYLGHQKNTATFIVIA